MNYLRNHIAKGEFLDHDQQGSMAKSGDDYLAQVKSLVDSYGEETAAQLIGVTQRAVQYWMAGTGSKRPRVATVRKIAELFAKHKSGEVLTDSLEDQKEESYREKYYRKVEEENERLRSELPSLDDLRRDLVMVAKYQTAIIDILMVLASESGKKGAYSKSAAVLRKHQLLHSLRDEDS